MSESPGTGRGDARWRAGAGLVAVTLACYWSTLDNAFLGDDFVFLSHLRFDSFTDLLRYAVGLDPSQKSFIRPLAAPLYALDHALFGLWAGGYHLTNVLLHAANGLLLHAVLRRTFPRLAFVGAALFVSAPITVEGVAWIASRFDLVMTACYLFGVLAMLRDRPVQAAVGAAGAMLAKESGVTFPLVAVAIALQRGRSLRPALPSVGVAIAYLAFRFAVLGGLGGYEVDGTPLWLSASVWKAARSGYLHLPALLAAPVNRAIAAVLPWAWVVGVAAGAAWLGLLRARTWARPLAVGLLWALATLAPTAPLPIGPTLREDRLLYLPSAGLALAEAWLLWNVPGPRVAAALVVASRVVATNVNLVAWESASEYSKAVVRALGTVPARAGRITVVLPWDIYGAYLGPNAAAFLPRLFRPGAALVSLTKAEARRLPEAERSSVIEPPLATCLPGVGTPRCWPRTPPTAGVTLNGRRFERGQTLRVGVEARNPADGIAADLYVGIVMPDGTTAVMLATDGRPGPPRSLLAPALLERTEAAPPGFALSAPAFFVAALPATLRAGTYEVFATLVRRAGLADNHLDDDEILALGLERFVVAPATPPASR